MQPVVKGGVLIIETQLSKLGPNDALVAVSSLDTVWSAYYLVKLVADMDIARLSLSRQVQLM